MMKNHSPLSTEDVGRLVVQPVTRESVALTTSTTVTTSATTFRVPIVQTDPVAHWISEGSEITPSDAVLSEITVTPPKIAGLTIVSRELADDSNPDAAAVVGAGLARDVAKKIDAAWFGALAAPAPAGLAALTGVQTVTGAFSNLDVFAEAVAKAEAVGATVSVFVTDPGTALALSKIKAGSGSNSPLLGQDATEAGQRRVLGVPLVSSPAVAAGTCWAYDRAHVWTVVRDYATLEVDRSVFFTSDRVAVRATMRVGFAFGHPASVVKITAAA